MRVAYKQAYLTDCICEDKRFSTIQEAEEHVESCPNAARVFFMRYPICYTTDR